MLIKIASSQFKSLFTVHGDCSHKMKKLFLLGRKTMTNLDSLLKRRDVTLPMKVHIVKATVFPIVMGRYELGHKGSERRRVDAFQLWSWRRLLRIPWTARRSNQLILEKSTLNIHWKD